MQPASHIKYVKTLGFPSVLFFYEAKYKVRLRKSLLNCRLKLSGVIRRFAPF